MTKSKTQERIDLYKFQLDTLLKFTDAVSANASDDELLNLYCNVLKDNLTIDKLVIFLKTKKEGWKVIADYGTSQNDYQDLDIDNDFADINSYETNLHIKIPKLHQFECVIPIYMDNEKICYVLMADTYEREGISPTIKHVRYLQILTSFIITSIEKRRLAQENLEQAILKGEIDSASKIQQQLIPNKNLFENNKYINVDYFYMPHFRTGGDYFDFDFLNKNEIFFCVADVTGKGLTAAMIMSNFQASLRSLISSNMDMVNLIYRLNSFVIKSTNFDRFITFFIAKYNFLSKQLTYINCGHIPPILFNKDKGQTKLLNKGCQGLGMVDDFPMVKVGLIDVEPNSKLIMVTDGVTEVEMNGEQDYGQMVLEEEMENKLSIKENIQNLKTRLNINKENKSLTDDITILGIDFL